MSASLGRGFCALLVECGCEAEAVETLVASGVGAFQPLYETEMKVRGSYVRVERPMAVGLVVASVPASAAADWLCEQLGCSQSILGEVPHEWLWLLSAPLLPMSTGYRALDGGVAVVSGPLAGREDLIARVERRKSTARLELDVAGRHLALRAGLAVLPVPTDPQARRAVERRAARRRDPA